MGIVNGQYDLELIRRTKKLLETYNGTFNITLLMNSLLSLIVLPQQHNSRIRKLSFMNQNLSTIEEIAFILNSDNFHFDRRNFNDDLKNLLNRIRNGISHQRIEAISQNGEWVGIIIEDYDRVGNLGLHLELTIPQVRELVSYITDKYLEETHNEDVLEQPEFDF